MSPIDNESQQSSTIYEKIIKNITEGWIFHEIIGLIRYRLGWGDIETIENINESDKLALIDYLKDSELGIWDRETEIIDNNTNNTEEPIRRKRLCVDDFISKYVSIFHPSIDNKQSNILLVFAKRSPFLSILGKIDSIYKSNNNNDKEEEEFAVTREEKWRREEEEQIIQESPEEKYKREQEEMKKW